MTEMSTELRLWPNLETKTDAPPEFGYWPNSTLKLFVTRSCNLACRGCFNRAVPMNVGGRFNEFENLTSSEMIGAMEDARFGFGTYAVEFSGGEPTLRSEVPDLISYGKKIGYSTRLTTNGVAFGASGIYRDLFLKLLPKQFHSLSAENMVDMYIRAGLDIFLFSVDNMHTVEDVEYNFPDARVPVSFVANAITFLLERKFGFPRDLRNHNILDSHGIRVSMTASGNDYKLSRKIVDEMMTMVNARPVIIQGEKLPKLWVTKDGQEIQLHRNEMADIGNGKNMSTTGFKGEEDFFSRNCFDFIPRSQSTIGKGINQEIAVNYNGDVYNCAMQSYLLGNIRTHSLVDIVKYVNTDTAPDEYRVGSSMFMEVMKISEETGGTLGWGEAYRRILVMDPSLKSEITSLRSHSGACYELGHSEKYLKLLKEYRRVNRLLQRS